MFQTTNQMINHYPGVLVIIIFTSCGGTVSYRSMSILLRHSHSAKWLGQPRISESSGIISIHHLSMGLFTRSLCSTTRESVYIYITITTIIIIVITIIILVTILIVAYLIYYGKLWLHGCQPWIHFHPKFGGFGTVGIRLKYHIVTLGGEPPDS